MTKRKRIMKWFDSFGFVFMGVINGIGAYTIFSYVDSPLLGILFAPLSGIMTTTVFWKLVKVRDQLEEEE